MERSLWPNNLSVLPFQPAEARELSKLWRENAHARASTARTRALSVQLHFSVRPARMTNEGTIQVEIFWEERVTSQGTPHFPFLPDGIERRFPFVNISVSDIHIR